MSSPLKIENLEVKAGKNILLQKIDLQLKPGELCALIGPSGAGKSTFIKVLLGLRIPSMGSASIAGRSVQESGPVGYVPQDDALHRALSVQECLAYTADLRLTAVTEASRRARVNAVIQQVGLADRADVAIKKLSGGQRKRVSVAMELLTSPPILILDEPTSGLDPGMEQKMMELFSTVAKSGRIVLVTTHAMQSLHLCHRLVVLMGGMLVYAGGVAEAPGFFGATSHNDIFARLATAPAAGWAAKWRSQAASYEAKLGLQVGLPTQPRSDTSVDVSGPVVPEKKVDPKLLEKLAALKAQNKP